MARAISHTEVARSSDVFKLVHAGTALQRVTVFYTTIHRSRALRRDEPDYSTIYPSHCFLPQLALWPYEVITEMTSQLLGVPETVLMVVFDVYLKVSGTVFGSAILRIYQVLAMAGAAETPVQ